MELQFHLPLSSAEVARMTLLAFERKLKALRKVYDMHMRETARMHGVTFK